MLMGGWGDVEKGDEEYIRELSALVGVSRLFDLFGMFTGFEVNGLGVF